MEREKSVKEILFSSGFTFKKSFGQNFITDGELLKSIADKAEIKKNDTVLEIGPGAGTLTRELSLRAKKVLCYEIDKTLKPVLAQTLDNRDNVDVVFEDVMKTPTAELEKRIGGKYIVVANLPYYITTPVLMKFIEEAKNAVKLVIMVQKEVAERICAKPSTAEYGAITVAVNLVGNAKIILDVKKDKFFPSPKVDSAVLEIDIDRKKFDLKDKKTFSRLVRSGFNNRRKMFINNFMKDFSFDRERTEKLFNGHGISRTCRGETLSCEDYVNLANDIGNYI